MTDTPETPDEPSQPTAAEPATGEPDATTPTDQVAQLKDQLLRALAETENVRRRAERDREDAGRYAVAAFARDLLAVADNLARALAALPTDKVQDDGVKNLLAGVQATERELVAAFERRGMRRVETEGRNFDPNQHQAMFEVEGTGKPAGTIVQVLAPGWMLHDRLLRAAMVGVAKGDAAPAPAEPPAAADATQRVDRKV
jgi:molecular chaperone GrpE